MVVSPLTSFPVFTSTSLLTPQATECFLTLVSCKLHFLTTLVEIHRISHNLVIHISVWIFCILYLFRILLDNDCLKTVHYLLFICLDIRHDMPFMMLMLKINNIRIDNLSDPPKRRFIQEKAGNYDHNAQCHLGQLNDWIVCVSLATCTCIVWSNNLSRICWSIEHNYKRSVNTLIIKTSSYANPWIYPCTCKK